MKKVLLFCFCFFYFSSFSQDEFMLWTKVGVGGKVAKKLSWSTEVNTRFFPGVQTFFPEFGLNYKVTKWFRPSIDYRFVFDKNKYGNFLSSSRINLNAAFRHKIKRFSAGLRLRYQSSFSRKINTEYNSDFDQAFRFRPSIEYKIKKTWFTPGVSFEWFLNPAFGPDRGLTKTRLSIGTSINLKGPHEMSFKYLIDKRTDYSRGRRFVLSMGYTYKL